MAFVNYTEQQIKEASEVDIVDLLRRRGEKVETAGSEHEWKHGGDTIKIRGGKWFNFYENEGGNAISFVWTAMRSVFRLFHHLGRILQEQLENQKKGRGQTESKLRRAIDEKKRAHGIKQE